MHINLTHLSAKRVFLWILAVVVVLERRVSTDVILVTNKLMSRAVYGSEYNLS